jgi:hypothetical protein
MRTAKTRESAPRKTRKLSMSMRRATMVAMLKFHAAAPQMIALHIMKAPKKASRQGRIMFFMKKVDRTQPAEEGMDLSCCQPFDGLN